MSALAGFSHVAVVTPDLDRLLDFYKKIFDSSAVRLDPTAGGTANALIDVGGGSRLHAFEAPADAVPAADRRKFLRGRLDHIALAAPNREAFLDLRRRLRDAGVGDDRVRDFGAAWGFNFRDPDGMEGEVIWMRDPDAPLRPPRDLAEWEINAD